MRRLIQELPGECRQPDALLMGVRITVVRVGAALGPDHHAGDRAGGHHDVGRDQRGADRSDEP